MRDRAIYTGLLFALTIMLIFSLGAGLWGEEHTISHWTGYLFQSVCHQNPQRSFIFMGEQMAVNTRCFGIFSGLWLGWLLIPLFITFNFGKKAVLSLLIIATIAQFVDVFGNIFSFWTNTNTSRAVLGLFLGTTVALFIGDLFNKTSIKPD